MKVKNNYNYHQIPLLVTADQKSQGVMNGNGATLNNVQGQSERDFREVPGDSGLGQIVMACVYGEASQAQRTVRRHRIPQAERDHSSRRNSANGVPEKNEAKNPGV